jgi:hypothetical protein
MRQKIKNFGYYNYVQSETITYNVGGLFLKQRK